MKNVKLTKAQEKLVQDIKQANGKDFYAGIRRVNTATALIKKGIIRAEDNGYGSNKLFLIEAECKEKTLNECKEDYVLACDKNGIQQRVKRGKDFIQFMIKNN